MVEMLRHASLNNNLRSWVKYGICHYSTYFCGSKRGSLIKRVRRILGNEEAVVYYLLMKVCIYEEILFSSNTAHSELASVAHLDCQTLPLKFFSETT